MSAPYGAAEMLRAGAAAWGRMMLEDGLAQHHSLVYAEQAVCLLLLWWRATAFPVPCFRASVCLV